MDRIDRMKKEFLGYKKIIGPVDYEWILKDCADIVTDESVPSFDYAYSSLDEVKAEVKRFYEKHFRIHDVYSMDCEENQIPGLTIEMPVDGVLESTKLIEWYYVFVKNCKKVSPFDLPVIEREGVDMEGRVAKAVFPISPTILPPFVNRVVPFINIAIGGKLNEAFAATYAHELMHTQIESCIGYTDDLCKREVIPVFIEKIYAYEKDPSGKMLNKVNKIRTGYDLKCLTIPLMTGKFEDDGCHATGGILGLALFDKYLKEQKEESRQEYFTEIQKVMEGRMKVEDILDKRGIDLKVAFRPELFKKYA